MLKLILAQRNIVSYIDLEIERLLLCPLGGLWLILLFQVLLFFLPFLVGRLGRLLRRRSILLFIERLASVGWSMAWSMDLMASLMRHWVLLMGLPWRMSYTRMHRVVRLRLLGRWREPWSLSPSPSLWLSSLSTSTLLHRSTPPLLSKLPILHWMMALMANRSSMLPWMIINWIVKTVLHDSSMVEFILALSFNLLPVKGVSELVIKLVMLAIVSRSCMSVGYLVWLIRHLELRSVLLPVAVLTV